MAKVSDMAAYYEEKVRALPFTEEFLRKLMKVRLSSADIHKNFSQARRQVDFDASHQSALMAAALTTGKRARL